MFVTETVFFRQRHFASLGSPLKNITAFPTRKLQERRYQSLVCTICILYIALPLIIGNSVIVSCCFSSGLVRCLLL